DAAKAATPAAPAAAAPAAAPAAAVPPKPASPWKGMLGGALLGLGLGALLSSMGIGGALANLISIALMVGLFALAAYFIYRLVTKKSGSAPQPAYAGAGSSPEPVSSTMERSASPAPAATPSSTRFRVPEIGSAIGSGAAVAATPMSTWSVPADFDSAGFLRSAKTYFVRLQAAWDKADITDLREFTTAEMFAELKVQLQERGPSPNLTDVVTLEAELLGIENIGRQDLASVKFTGTIREEANGPAEPFAEVWNIAKPAGAKDGWMLAGIQQIQ
ncbi:MAG: Tim44 domain-containing protein, partial [Betaproteobacteria bacterium]|nr:Tim44 domain-containing protein [Betaproteobacteria bacterium]